MATMRPGSSLSGARGMGAVRRRSGTQPILAPYTLREGEFAQRDPALQARLFAESVGWPNLAGDQYVVEQARIAVLQSLKDVFNVHEFLRNKWLILYRLYRGETLVQFQYGRNQLHSPEPFKAVEAQHPRMMRALFGNQRWYKLFADGNTPDANAVCQERMTRDQFRAMRYLAKQSRFIRDGLIYGTAGQKTWWKQEIDEMMYRDGRRVPDPDGLEGTTKVELEEVKRTEIVFDGNYVDNISIFDLLGPPNASDVEDAEWMGDRSSWADYRVKQMGELGHWVNLAALKDHPGSNDFSMGDEFKERKSYSYGVFDPREATWAPHIPHYEVIDWWGPLAIRKSGGVIETKMVNVVMVEPESLGLIVRVTVNPFWHKKKPYQLWRPIALEDELYGIGTIEMIARNSMELDMKKNLFMASAQLAGNPCFAIADDSNIPDGQLLLQPGLSWRVPDPQNAIAPIHIPDTTDVLLKAMNIQVKDIRETTGTTSPALGASDPFGRGKTATQHTSEVDEANTRLAGPIFQWELDVGESMLFQMTWNNQQFKSFPTVVREVGAFGMTYTDRYTIRPEDVIGRFIIQMLAGSRWTMKQQQVQQLINLLDRAPVVNQMYGPQAVKMIPLWATILDNAFDIRNVEDFLTLPPTEAGLLTTIEEHQAWYHGNIPPLRKDDNHAVHAMAHMEELKSEQFAELERKSPQTAARARNHVMDHIRWAAQAQEGQLKALMEAFQQGTVSQLLRGGGGGMGGGMMGGGGIEGAATPDQQPGSPQIRRNENERQNGTPPGNEQRSDAMSGAPNPGAQ